MERVYTLDEIDQVAHELITAYAKQNVSGAVVWGLRGDLGAGKTTLAQALARKLGVIETVTSPTFVLEKVYHLQGKHFEHLIHMDAYRLEKPEELLVLGWDDLIKHRAHFIVLEWPERVAKLLPPQTLIFNLLILDEHTRRITYGA